MGELILFRPREGRRRSGAVSGDGVEAQIMFFTGVRYERMREPAVPDGGSDAPCAGGLSGARNGRRRKRG